MDKHLKECLSRLDSNVQSAVDRGRVNGRPFVELANHTGAVFCGFEVLLEIIQTDRMKESHGDDDVLNQYESGALLSMMRATCNVMAGRVEELADWADERMKEQGKEVKA